ncbi:hypothetical protein EYV94_21515 [Puteibacter caeruleilacunae]|nr:hypothetical protein EYV94_21515 [Puteibacter caeruleilacunae]
MKNTSLYRMNCLLSFSLLLMLTLGYKNTVAQQENPQISPPVIPPSPEAMAFQIYGDFPVSHYTGTVNISIPIYTVSVDEVQIPVSLSYHPSGIKVNQTASCVGLGWTLNGTGVITRVVNGIPDEWSYGILDKSKGYDIYYHTIDDINYSEGATGDSTDETEYIYGVKDGVRDSESDTYSLNCFGLSTKFILDADGNAHCFPNSNIQIEKDGENWRVKSIAGTTYIFSKTEFTSTISLTPRSDASAEANADPRVTGWYLTKIITSKGKDINFNYGSNGSSISFSASESACYMPYAMVNGFYTNELKSFSEFQIEYITPTLSSIEFPGGKIKVELSNDARTDVRSPSYPVENVEIRDLDNMLIKKFKLSYDYFISEANDYFGNRRLKLTKVQEMSSTGEALPPYEFGYYESHKLPVLSSLAQDYWGFYNGAIGNKTRSLKMIPAKSDIKNSSDIDYVYDGANREPKFPEMMAWTLNQIKYPTGGESSFEYEAHNYYDNETSSNKTAGGLRIKRVISKESDTAIPTVKEYRYDAAKGAFNSSAGFNHDPHYYLEYSENIYLPCIGPQICPPGIVTSGYGGTIPLQTVSEIFNSSPFNGLGLTRGASVGYGRVEEWKGYMSGGAASFADGYTEYVYSVPNWDTYITKDAYSGFIDRLGIYVTYMKAHMFWHSEVFLYPFIDYPSKDWEEGLLQEKRVYDHNNDLKYYVKNNYSTGINPKNIGMGLKVSTCPYMINAADNEHHMGNVIYQRYFIHSDRTRLDRVLTKTYEESDSITTEQLFTYNEDHILVKEVKTTDSRGREITQIKSYPFDYSVEPYNSMVNDNYLPVVKSITKVDGVQNSGVEYFYSSKRYMTDADRSQYLIDSISELHNQTWDTKVCFDKYDRFGNLQQLHKKNDQPTTYLWAYNSAFPVAKVVNANYDQVELALGGSSIVNSLQTSTSKSYINSKGDMLRSNLTDAFVSSFTYQPMKGIDEATDPNGLKTKYNYDSFGRLMNVMNDDSEIQKQIRYNYNTELSVSPSSLSFTSGGETKRCAVNSNVNWSLVNKPGWITVSPTSGEGSDSISVAASYNSSIAPRSGAVVIKAGDIEKRLSVAQATSDTIIVSPRNIDNLDNPVTVNVSASSNICWTVTIDQQFSQPWVLVEDESGNNVSSACGYKTLIIKADLNVNPNQLGAASVTISGNGITCTININSL